MHYNKYYISLFQNLLLFNSLLTNCFTQELEWITNDSILQEYIRANFPRIAVETSQLCNLPGKTKLAICDYIFHRMREGRDIYLEYTNKIAFSLLNADCVKNPVIFDRPESLDLDIIIPQQYMMQCYGRYDPIRTSWIEDDFFDTLYVCGGIDSTSFIILGHDRTIDKYYRPAVLIEHLIPEELPEVEITRNNLNEELISLQSISVNVFHDIVEDLLMYENYKPKLENYDSICNLKTSNKILLCEKIMNFGREYFQFWILDETAFNDDSSQCVEKPLKLRSKSSFIEANNTIQQKMFPCYGQDSRFDSSESDVLYLSAGHSEHSVLLYMEDAVDSASYIVDLYENVRLENLLNF